jgi:cytoskeletal protein CcmA (bactofilin family)
MTQIGPAVSIVGDIDCETDLLVEGRVRGRVRLRDVTLVIGSQGLVDGDIRGTRVVVHGVVRGSIWASERIEVAASGAVHGSLSANRIVLADGAIVNGRVDMDQRTIAAAVAKYKAEQAGATA